MISLLKKKLDPPRYQGLKKKYLHFEGWYFKIVDNSRNNRLAIIPGIFNDKNLQNSHSFIQIFNGVTNKTFYNRYPLDDFQSKENIFNIQINSNSFSSNQILLNFSNPSLKIKGELNFKNRVEWPKSLISPGIMGWYTWVPFMECYHGIVSLNHVIQGTLTINDQKIDFSGGKGYTEKDWGKTFPEAWLWCQSNHFSGENVSFTGSVAIIPWIGRPFLGFIFGFWYNNKLYRFTTYTGAKLIHLRIEKSQIELVLEQKGLYLEILINRNDGGFLQAPTINGMTHQISETMQSSAEIKLSQKSVNKSDTIFEGIGQHAGFEIAGNAERLIEIYKKSKSER